MTALSEYARLEAPGVWRASPEAQRRDVFVSIGDSSLTINDSRDIALAHWSLPAILRRNPGEVPALYTPGEDADEQLELDDPLMIDAIERVRNVIARRRAKPGRLRFAITGVIAAAILALGALWLPDALVRYTASIVPGAKRAEIGELVLDRIARVAGTPCASPLGTRALSRLSRRLLGSGRRIVVLAGGLRDAAHLPDGTILIDSALLEDHEGPEVAAGHILNEDILYQQADPMELLLSAAGFEPALRLLTSGEVTQDAINAYTEELLTQPSSPPQTAALLPRFDAAGVSATPYARALDITGETTLELIEADPVPPDTALPLLNDGEWISLQGICGN